jgi:ABC-type sulfate/molybdate transport systems ATPase subunit
VSNVTQRRKFVKSAPIYGTFVIDMTYPTRKVSFAARATALMLMRLTAGLATATDVLLRPQEVNLLDGSEGDGTEVLVERVVQGGSELRVELRLGDGTEIWGRVTREEARELELREGQILQMRPAGATVRRLARAA